MSNYTERAEFFRPHAGDEIVLEIRRLHAQSWHEGDIATCLKVDRAAVRSALIDSQNAFFMPKVRDSR